MSKRLLFLVNNIDFLVSHRLPIAVAACEKGLEVHIAAPNPEGSSHLASLRQKGLIVHALPIKRAGINLFREIRTVLSIYRLIKEVDADCLHLVSMKPVLYGTFIERFLGRGLKLNRVICAFSGLGYLFIQESPLAWIIRQVVLLGLRVSLGSQRTRVVFQNDVDHSFFVSRGLVRLDQAVMIRGSGVNTEEYTATPEPEGTPIVLFPARLILHKGLMEFLVAAHRLLDQGVRVNFLLAGDLDPGNPSCIAKEELLRWTTRQGISWMGHCKNMPEVFRNSHIVCLPSYREGLPKALLEAAASARCIVTTDVPGCNEVVENGVNGLLVPPRDATALARALLKLINDQGLREKMGRQGRKLAEEHFNVGRIVAQTLVLYGIKDDAEDFADELAA